MRTSLEEWISVSQHDLNEVESREQRGLKVQFMVAPSDLPSAWRVVHEKADSVEVEFKYLGGNEPKQLEHCSNNITLEVGKNSKRIYKITLDVRSVPTSGELMISRAADVVEHGSGLNKGNSEVIHRFLTSKRSKPEILERMAP
ncbi:hypothetical protein RG836_06025 [Pseudomonas sp. SZMC_28357]|jgi:hypothetical protein|uniref:hypothetical protein n=1 Tax=unclassified Pseudomonas TaxID=196821 RepID=UPI00201868D1|nr:MULTISPECIES: hypothetical protein [unclassified Pseudomonas]MDR9750996.1 hypothetical protein [Pseudomonas sp. SZMC_28357]UQS13318.1 hypothetical protein JJN09_19070 [Pseudomonas sp. HS6]